MEGAVWTWIEDQDIGKWFAGLDVFGIVEVIPGSVRDLFPLCSVFDANHHTPDGMRKHKL
jgi:hypothetical protein